MSIIISQLELGDDNWLFKLKSDRIVGEPVEYFHWTLRCRNFTDNHYTNRHDIEHGLIQALYEYMKSLKFDSAGGVRKGYSVIVFSTEADLDAYWREAKTAYMLFKLGLE